VIGALALLVYAVGAGTGGAAALRHARWPHRVPRLGVAAWQALSGSVLIALLLAGLSVFMPATVVGMNLAEFLRTCVMALRAQYATPGGALGHALAATATLALTVRVTVLLVTGLRRARQDRDQHLTHLRLAARRDLELDAMILEHPMAAAYCLPGRANTVVLTTAAVAALAPAELAAVLVHERAHLRGRHHLVAAAALVLARAVPFLPVFDWARQEQSRLLEMIADDQAADHGTRLTVARALVHLAEGSVPAAALGAADIAAVARVQRLLAPAPRLGVARRVAITAAILVTAALPIAIAAAPALAAAQMEYCPITSPSGNA
jgi:Zn-dependent protease with chaperone function